MKKIHFIVLSFVCAFLPYVLDAQTKEDSFRERFPYKYEFRAGMAGYPLADASQYGNGLKLFYCEPFINESPSLNDLYAHKSEAAYMTGILFGEFSAHFKRWFSLAVTIGVNGLWGNGCDYAVSDDVKHYSGAMFTVLPEARFNWVNSRTVRLYSSVGLGVSAGWYDGDYGAYPAFQIAPFGISLGRKVFFFAEYNFGTSFLGGKFGLGYRL